MITWPEVISIAGWVGLVLVVIGVILGWAIDLWFNCRKDR